MLPIAQRPPCLKKCFRRPWDGFRPRNPRPRRPPLDTKHRPRHLAGWPRPHPACLSRMARRPGGLPRRSRAPRRRRRAGPSRTGHRLVGFRPRPGLPRCPRRAAPFHRRLDGSLIHVWAKRWDAVPSGPWPRPPVPPPLATRRGPWLPRHSRRWRPRPPVREVRGSGGGGALFLVKS